MTNTVLTQLENELIIEIQKVLISIPIGLDLVYKNEGLFFCNDRKIIDLQNKPVIQRVLEYCNNDKSKWKVNICIQKEYFNSIIQEENLKKFNQAQQLLQNSKIILEHNSNSYKLIIEFYKCGELVLSQAALDELKDHIKGLFTEINNLIKIKICTPTY